MAKADLLVVNARIWNGRDVPEQAIAVSRDRIAATGSNRAMRELADESTETIDVGDRRLIPGLIDSHLHLVRAGRTWHREVRWDHMDELDDALSALRDKARELGPGRWVGVMGGWHPHQFTKSRGPTREMLDRAVPDNPVFAQRAYAETLLNSRAMAEMGWTEDDAPEGRITTPPDMAGLRAKLAVTDIDEAMSGTASLLRELNRLGLTGAIDASGFGMTAASYDAFIRLFAKGERGFRARLLLGAANPGTEMSDMEEWTSTVTLDSADAFIRYLGAGEVLDHAAHDLEGLAPKDITTRVGQLRHISAHLARHGWPVHLHAILDDSIGVVLDAWESIDDVDIARLRWAICHADQIGAENLRRVADLGIGITFQNGMSMRGVDCDPNWGTDVVTRAPPIKTMLDLRIPVAAGTDGTVACVYNPWRCISWMVTGESVDGAPPRVESERLSVDEALTLYTAAGAWFSFEEEERGDLRPGALADFIVLTADPFRVPPDQLVSIESAMTVVGGTVVHSTLETGSVTG